MKLSLKKRISSADVSACYRVLLRREPESKEAIQAKLGGYRTLEELLADFVQSQEYRSISKFSRDDVFACYRLLLGREPENEEVIRAKLSGNRTFSELLEEFIGSEEYRVRHQGP
jgi:hypothetical protein